MARLLRQRPRFPQAFNPSMNSASRAQQDGDKPHSFQRVESRLFQPKRSRFSKLGIREHLDIPHAPGLAGEIALLSALGAPRILSVRVCVTPIWMLRLV